MLQPRSRLSEPTAHCRGLYERRVLLSKSRTREAPTRMERRVGRCSSATPILKDRALEVCVCVMGNATDGARCAVCLGEGLRTSWAWSHSFSHQTIEVDKMTPT